MYMCVYIYIYTITYVYIYIYIYIERETLNNSNNSDNHISPMLHFQLGSFPIRLVSNWVRFSLGSIITAFLPNGLPN